MTEPTALPGLGSTPYNSINNDSIHDTIAQSVGVEIPIVDMLRAMREDCVTFFSFYLGEELTLEVPDFHIAIWQELLDCIRQLNQRKVTEFLQKLWAIPREHAKSTIAKLATILILKYTDLSFVLYTSKTNGIAKNAVRDILMWLTGDNERKLFGPCTIIKSSETDSLWIIRITLRELDGSTREKTCIFKALGSEQQVRGLLILNKRPEIIVIDDVEDLDNTKDEDQQRNLDEWVIGSLMKARAKRAFIMMLGNVIRKTTLLARLMKDKDWNPTVLGALVRDKETRVLRALWPGRHSVESLLLDYRNHRKAGVGYIWEYEMMNLTQDEVNTADMSGVKLVDPPLVEDVEAGCLILDPAFGLNSWNDNSCITVHAKIRGMDQPVVIDHRLGKMTETEIFDEMLNLSLWWGVTTWFIESVAAQKLLLPYFDLLMQTREMNRELIMMIPLPSGQNSKASRILAFREAVRSASYGISLNEIELVEVLGMYNPDSQDKDDYPDSAAYGVIAWKDFNRLIMVRGNQRVVLTAQGFTAEQKLGNSAGQLQVAVV